jgi:hypothetical protein
MAGVKISALPAALSAQLTDEFAVVQAGVTKKETLAQMLDITTSSPTVRLATTGALTASYNNGSSGVGATLTNSGALAALSIDSVAAVLNDRVLVKNQASQFQNGIYIVTTVGSGAVAWVLTRATDYNTPAVIDQGDLFTVGAGTANGKTQWIQTAAGPFTIGTTAITFESNVEAGTGVTKTNNIISIVSGGFTWTEVTGTTVNLVPGNGYILNNVALVTATIPATFSLGAAIALIGKGAGLYAIAQNASQSIRLGNQTTTPGVGGSLTATDAADAILLVGSTADTVFTAQNVIGNFTVV